MRHLLYPILVALASPMALATEITNGESRWLRAGWPVIAYARKQGLPLDVVVQPQSSPGLPPIAMGIDHGRCKLVLSMRGNPEADAPLAALDEAMLPAIVEAVFAHELAHCWRHVQGGWHRLPADLEERPVDSAEDAEPGRSIRVMRQTRREEAYADLVALAWTLQTRPSQYQQVHAWLEAYRAEERIEGAHHDTGPWIRLVRDPNAFGAGTTPFKRAEAPWRRGLLDAD